MVRLDSIRPESQLGAAWTLASRTGGIAPVVDADGNVAEAAINRSEPVCVRGKAPVEFEHSALESARSWQFFAAQVCTFPEGVEPNVRCDGEGVSSRLVPIRLTYVFDFSQSCDEVAVKSRVQESR